jgi:PAS domain S-box-containing protein
MAPRKGDSNELKKFLLASKEKVVKKWLADLRSRSELRKKLPDRTSVERQIEFLSAVYDSLANPLSSPTKTGKTQKARLKKDLKQDLRLFSLSEIMQAQLMLLDALTAAVKKKYAGKPKKIGTLSGRLTERMHDIMLQIGKAHSKRHEAAMARAEGKYSRLLEMANDAIFMPDYKTGLFVDVNEAACRLTGYSESELKQMGFNSLISVFDLNLMIEKTDAVLAKGAVRFDDVSIYTKTGAEVPVDISVSVVIIDGKRHLIAIVRDIKERKALETKLREEAARLRLINEIGSYISSSDLGIEAVLTRILEAVAKVIRVEAGSILRLEEDELVFVVALGEKAEHVKPFKLKLGQGIAGWVAQTGEYLVVRDVHRDPRYYPGIEKATGFVTRSMLATPMKTGDKTVGVIELINKVGGPFTRKDLKLLRAISSFSAVALEHAGRFSECELANTRLTEAGSPLSSSQLAAVVAHEMKDPLGILKNYVRILRDELSPSGIGGDELAVVSDETDRIASIADQLLNFSETAAEAVRETPLNLLVQNSIESMDEKLKSAGITTELKLGRALPPISIIPNQMKMVFSNLVRLAMADMPDGGTLTVATRKRDSQIYVEFSNTGIKHSGKEAKELFLPSAVAKGLVPKGIGLYMAHNVMRGYGGDIEVRPRKGGGSTFRITIPMALRKSPGGAQG